MNWKTWLPLLVAMVFAVGAAKATRDWMIRHSAPAHSVGDYTRIVVAKSDIQPGTALRADDLTFAEVQTDRAPSGAFSAIAQLNGRATSSLLVRNQPVLEANLAPQGAGSGLQALIPAGMRAITVEVNEYSGVAGMLQPGCRVDIIATLSDGTPGGQIARTIVQNVEITAVGQRTSPNSSAGASSSKGSSNPADAIKSVTVLSTPSQAEAIELACATGRPRLVLRSGRDARIVPVAGLTLGELTGSAARQASIPIAVVMPPPIVVPATQPAVAPSTQPAPPVAFVTPTYRVIRMIKGGVESNVNLEMTNQLAGTATANIDPFERR